MKTDFKEQLHDERPYWKVIVSLAFSLLGTALFVFLGARLLVFFMPFVIGWFIAYIASPVVNWLERRLKIVKKLGSAIIIIGVLAGLVFLLYFAGSRLWREIMALIQNMPDLYQQLESGLGDIGKTLEGVFTVLPKGIQNGWHAMVSNLDSTMGDLIGRFSEPTVAAAGNFAKKIPSVLIALSSRSYPPTFSSPTGMLSSHGPRK